MFFIGAKGGQSTKELKVGTKGMLPITLYGIDTTTRGVVIGRVTIEKGDDSLSWSFDLGKGLSFDFEISDNIYAGISHTVSTNSVSTTEYHYGYVSQYRLAFAVIALYQLTMYGTLEAEPVPVF